MKIRSRWRDGSVEFIVKAGILVLKSMNNALEFRPRSIIVEDGARYKEFMDGRRRYIYVYYSEELKPLPFQPTLKLRDIDEFTIENYSIRYTKARVDEYYTIITPGTHLYDYVIVSSDEVGIVLSSKREVYFDQTGRTLTIYIV